ncbi:MAG: YtxH domain-containing protein [Thermodesulfovibrionales bacterium]|nr:YtxH domain-containing protein [Thermodesulfovibrionales bacterium]
MKDNDGHSVGTVFLSFLFGGIVGAGLAMLLAPQSGSETRKRIKEFADDMREKAEDYVEDIKKGVTSTVEEGKDFYEEKKSAITTAVEAGKKAYEKEKERLSKS